MRLQAGVSVMDNAIKIYTPVARMGLGTWQHTSANAWSWLVLTVGMAGAISAVLVVLVVLVLVTRDMHVFTDGSIGMIGTGGTGGQDIGYIYTLEMKWYTDKST